MNGCPVLVSRSVRDRAGILTLNQKRKIAMPHPCRVLCDRVGFYFLSSLNKLEPTISGQRHTSAEEPF